LQARIIKTPLHPGDTVAAHRGCFSFGMVIRATEYIRQFLYDFLPPADAYGYRCFAFYNSLSRRLAADKSSPAAI